MHRELDPDYPATLSKEIVDGTLRKKLGFNGVVLTDCMQMGAIVEAFGFEEAVHRAILAGADILVYSNNIVYQEDVARQAIDALVSMVKNGRISSARIDESWRRITALKSKLK
jgi:beta-N-acetylhexosaminidase